ncbi:MAG: NTP transferase domain-containing protein [Alkaliphilus sp.]|nr:NTP transferase domain-containing protein [Alkaliphilus sp.]
MLKAVILAGHEPQIGDEALDQLQEKSTCMIGEKMMIEYVVDALLKSTCVDHIAVIGDRTRLHLLESIEHVEVIQSTNNLADNVVLGINRFKGENVLVSTSDIPMLTEQAVRDFVLKGQSLKADLCYSIINKQKMQEKYPENLKTYVKLKEGRFTGGNLFLLNSKKIDNFLEIGKKMLLYRKKPWKMVKILGIFFLVKLILGRLSILDVEKRVASMMGIRGKAVICDYPEVGNDVDKPADLALAIKYMT